MAGRQNPREPDLARCMCHRGRKSKEGAAAEKLRQASSGQDPGGRRNPKRGAWAFTKPFARDGRLERPTGRVERPRRNWDRSTNNGRYQPAAPNSERIAKPMRGRIAVATPWCERATRDLRRTRDWTSSWRFLISLRRATPVGQAKEAVCLLEDGTPTAGRFFARRQNIDSKEWFEPSAAFRNASRITKMMRLPRT